MVRTCLPRQVHMGGASWTGVKLTGEDLPECLAHHLQGPLQHPKITRQTTKISSMNGMNQRDGQCNVSTKIPGKSGVSIGLRGRGGLAPPRGKTRLHLLPGAEPGRVRRMTPAVDTQGTTPVPLPPPPRPLSTLTVHIKINSLRLSRECKLSSISLSP